MNPRLTNISLTIFEKPNPIIEWHKSERIKDVYYQLERGSENGNLHWQCHVHFDKQCYVNKEIEKLGLAPNSWHWEPIKTNDKYRRYQDALAAHISYCQKKDTRERGPFEFHRRPLMLKKVKNHNGTPADRHRYFIETTKNNIMIRQFFIDNRYIPTVIYT